MKRAEAFPNPRSWSEISFEVLLASQLTTRFAAVYSHRKAGYVLRSARVLGSLGYSVEVLEPGDGLSGRGTEDDKLYGDVLRKLFGKMERDAKVRKEDKRVVGVCTNDSTISTPRYSCVLTPLYPCLHTWRGIGTAAEAAPSGSAANPQPFSS